MRPLLSFLLCLLLCTGCSVLGIVRYAEPADDNSGWESIKGFSGMDSPASQGWYLCDSAGFMLVHCGEYAHRVAWGPVLLPFIPGSISRRDGVAESPYSMILAIQAKSISQNPDVIEHLRFSFNGDTTATRPGLRTAYPIGSWQSRSPCCNTTHIPGSNLLVNSAEFHLYFDIHPDSIRTITITADEEFRKQTGFSFTSLVLKKSKRLYYMPFVFYAS